MFFIESWIRSVEDAQPLEFFRRRLRLRLHHPDVLADGLIVPTGHLFAVKQGGTGREPVHAEGDGLQGEGKSLDVGRYSGTDPSGVLADFAKLLIRQLKGNLVRPW